MQELRHFPFFSNVVVEPGSIRIEAVCGRYVDQAATTLDWAKVTCDECTPDVQTFNQKPSGATTSVAPSVPAQYKAAGM
jgi:hypothetical protein